MQIDLQCDPPPFADKLRAQVCIAGGGLAGLTLADSLVNAGIQVILLEAGGAACDGLCEDPFGGVHYSHDLHKGTDRSRVCAFGGTSLVWGGQLLSLRDGSPQTRADSNKLELEEGTLQFVNHPPPDRAWPLPAASLAPFVEEAEALFAVNSAAYEASDFFTNIAPAINANHKPIVPKLLSQLEGFDARVSKFAPFHKRNLAVTLGARLRRHAESMVLLHAPVTAVQRDEAGAAASHALVRTPSGGTLRIEADHFILAAGTVETCRLLLASRLGNQHDQVGRGLHDHLTVTAATATGRARDRLLFELRPWVLRCGTLHSLKLEASATMRRRLGLTPAMAHLTFEEPAESGAAALRSVLRGSQRGGIAAALAKALPQLPAAALEAARLWTVAATDHRRYVSRRAGVGLRLNVAQEVSPESRITLSDRVNSQALPEVNIAWRVREPERLTLRRFSRELQRQLAAAGIGEGLAWDPALLTDDDDAPLPPLDDARHAMGGALMGTDPRASVVAPDLRVHGLRNLWVASAAVFPDGCAQLPGLTLIALCLRLAARLAAEVRREPGV